MPADHAAALFTYTPPRILAVDMNKQTFLALPALADASPTTIATLASSTAAHQLHALGWLQQADITYWGNFDAAGFAILDAEKQRAFRFLFNQGRLRIKQERVLFMYANAEIREPEIFGPSTHKKTLTGQ